MMQDACLKPSTLQEIKQHTAKDDSLQELIKVIKAGWPKTKEELSHLVLPYFGIRDELSGDNDVVVREERLVSGIHVMYSSLGSLGTRLHASLVIMHNYIR